MADNSAKTTDERAKAIVEFMRGSLVPTTAVDLNFVRRHLEEHANPVYEERARVLALACWALRYYSGPFMDPMNSDFEITLGRHDENDKSWDPEWMWIVYVEWKGSKGHPIAPFQASWHIHKSHLHLFGFITRTLEKQWDGHTTEEKYRNIEKLTLLEWTAS